MSPLFESSRTLYDAVFVALFIVIYYDEPPFHMSPSLSASAILMVAHRSFMSPRARYYGRFHALYYTIMQMRVAKNNQRNFEARSIIRLSFRQRCTRRMKSILPSDMTSGTSRRAIARRAHLPSSCSPITIGLYHTVFPLGPLVSRMSGFGRIYTYFSAIWRYSSVLLRWWETLGFWEKVDGYIH